MEYIAVLTGDVIGSQRSQQIWADAVDQVLKDFGKAPQDWFRYRGDSFQLRLQHPAEALRGKAC